MLVRNVHSLHHNQYLPCLLLLMTAPIQLYLVLIEIYYLTPF